MKHRVAIVGSFAEGALAASISRAFSGLGWSPIHEPWPTTPSSMAWIATRYPRAAQQSVRRMIRGAARWGPVDLVIVVKGTFLLSKEILALRRAIGAPVVCWNPDDPLDFAISNRGAGIPNAASAYDAYVTWSETVASRIRSLVRRVIVVPFGWDESLHHPVAPTSWEGRPVFIGTWTSDRSRWLESILEFRPVVYGNGWDKGPPELEVRPGVYGEAFCQAVANAGVMLNFLRPQNVGSHNMRTFEIPGCGGFQLAQTSAEHERFLEGRSALFRDQLELRAILAEGIPPNRPEVPDWLRQHSYQERVAQLLGDL